MWRLGPDHWIRKVAPDQGPISWQSVIKTFLFYQTKDQSNKKMELLDWYLQFI
jgi:hypothetical protein